MNVLVRPAEIVTAADTVSVFGVIHPLLSRRVHARHQAGLTIDEMIALTWPQRRGAPVVAWLNGDPVPTELWGRVRPKAGTVLTFRAVVEGKGIFKTIATLVVAVVATVFTAGLAAPLIGAAFGAGVGAAFAAGTLGAALAGAVVAIGGSLLVNALFPVEAPKNELSSPSEEAVPRRLGLSGSNNQGRAYQAIPVVLGRHKMSPAYAAKPYTEIAGDDQYLYLFFCWGYGPLIIDDMSIGETPLSRFSDYTDQTVYGYETDAPISVYPAQVDEQSLSIELAHSVYYARVTEPETDRIIVDLTAPNGIFQIDQEKGTKDSIQIVVEVYLRNLAAGGAALAGTVSFDKDLSTSRRYLNMNVARGQYEVTVRRAIGPTPGEYTFSTIVWTALRSIKNVAPVKPPVPLAMTAIKIRATEQLSGVIDTFNAVVSSRCIAFDGTVWRNNQPTSNPADLFRYVLQHPANAQAEPDEAIDLETLEEWWRFCDERGFRFDGIVESTTSVYRQLAAVASAGRAAISRPDGRWSVIWDRFDAPVAQVFTARNSSGFSIERAYKPANKWPHALRVRFANAEKGFAEDEAVVYADGYDAGNATLFEEIELPGQTIYDQVWKHARYRYAQIKLRPETATLKVDFEYLTCQRGDLVEVQNDVILSGQISGRVKSVVGDVVTLDETVTMLADTSYALRIRTPAGEPFDRTVETNVGEHRSLTLTGTGLAPEPGDLVMFGESGKVVSRWRVSSVRPADELKATLTLVNDAPGIDGADSGVIPEFDSGITAPINLADVSPQDLTAIEIVEGISSAQTVKVRLSWRVPREGRVTGYEAQYRDEASVAAAWSAPQVVTQRYADFAGLLLGNYSFRVRALYTGGAQSNWTVLTSRQLTGTHLSSPLPDVQRLRTAFVDGVMKLDWDEVTDFRAVVYEIRQGDLWASAITVGELAHPPFAVPGNGTFFVTAKARPLIGLEVRSVNPASLTLAGTVLVRNVVAEADEHALGWDGTFSGTVQKSGDVIRTGGGGDLLAASDFLGIESLLDYGGGGAGAYEIPSSRWVDVGRVAPCPVMVSFLPAGSRSDVSILADPDFLANPDVLDAAAAREIEVYVEISLGDNDPSDIYAAGDVYDDGDVYGRAIDWSPWRRWTPGVYLARHFRFRVVLNTLTPNVIANCLSFSWRVDMPDRLDNYRDVDVPEAGKEIVFWPDGAMAAAAFNGGPNFSPVPYVNVTILDGDGGDLVTLSDLSATGVTVAITNGGTPVARTVNITAQGF